MVCGRTNGAGYRDQSSGDDLAAPCHHRLVPIAIRRSGSLILAALLLVSIAGPTTAGPVATGTAAPSVAATAITAQGLIQSGLDLVERTNKKRTKRGLVRLRVDQDLMAIARDRAQVMADDDVLSHNGQDVFDRLEAAGVSNFGASEIIAWNSYPNRLDSVREAIRGWMHSSGHRAIMLSTNRNYVGYGVAISASGKRYYAGVFVKEPDETVPRASVKSATKQVLDASSIRVKVRWAGADRRLQVLTAGLRHFEVEWSRDGGAWQSWGTTTDTSRTRTWSRGSTYDVRVRGLDKAGNVSNWRTFRVKT